MTYLHLTGTVWAIFVPIKLFQQLLHILMVLGSITLRKYLRTSLLCPLLSIPLQSKFIVLTKRRSPINIGNIPLQ